ncbi:iron-containing alcohol dehydrogenase family protein [Vibrio sp. SCSIO 43137]|uniref:iron-containing alcohol dehydrogenase family protein n=1 Tax=Vibrio sp. SCSIO 43137 TaxID=3021011 RepID=UPI0023075A2F|nr:iron-containing alcohol dehydrogenase family protein [Vibrio sp. SCSIO 43137]WCE29853.1 iron-containing alcohol dehydrogenase family protein [Vibrio sp. SCSIO 43137]
MLKLRFPLPVFRSAKEIVNGQNARMALKGLVANRVALIVSSAFKRSSYCEQLERLINADSVLLIEKSWDGEPSVESLSGVLCKLEKFQPDYILALGGGSVIDGAKLAWLLYEHPTLSNEQLFRPFSLPSLRGKAKFAAIPTTVGAGSEVSSAAVMLDTSSSSKKAVVTHEFIPDLVILDPELVQEVSHNILKTTVADALSHAVEGYVSQINHPLMDSFAEKAVEIVASYIDCFDDESWDLAMIADLQYASMLAGWVQNHKIVGLSHAIAHQLGSLEIGHGLANGLLMPEVISFNAGKDKETAKKYQKLCSKASIENVSQLRDIFKKLTKGQYDSKCLSEADLERIATGALLDPAAKSNPVTFSEIDVKEIVIKCL